MKRFINPQKSTYYSNALVTFSDENRPMYTGIVKGYSTKKYSWINDFLFKHRTNFSTNSNIAYVSFFSDRETVYQEYGNIPELYIQYPFLQTYQREKIPSASYELSSPQYRKIGQKNTDFDLIQFINASGKLYSQNGELNINHYYKYDPIFHAEGYKIYGYPNNKSKFIWITNYEFGDPLQTVDQTRLNLSNFVINLGNNQSDVDPDSRQYVELNAPGHVSNERVIDYKIQIDHKNFYYFTDLKEWVVYYTRTESFNGNDKKPYFGAVVCYDINNNEMHPSTIRYFPDVLVDGKVEAAKIIITWPEKISGKCAFYPGNVSGVQDDQSRFVCHICDKMFNDDTYPIIKKVVGGDVIYDGIDLDTERNKRHYATVMTEPYFMTKAINNGVIVKYKFIDKNNNDINYGNNENTYIANPGIYLKIKCNLDTIKEIDRLLSLENYNTDIIDTLIIKNPEEKLLPSSGSYYKKFKDISIPNIFYQRQDDGIFDLLYNRLGETDPFAKHATFVIQTWNETQDNYYDGKPINDGNHYMKIAGIGFYTDTALNEYNSVIENKYLALYCTNYISDKYDDATIFLDNGETSVLKIDRNEKFKPLIKLDGINGYVKILKKNKTLPVTQTSDGQYEVIYTVEFPYCPGSYTERYKMNFSSGYQPTQILYVDTYISAGNKKIYSDAQPVTDFTNDRNILSGGDSFTYVKFAGSGEFVTTMRFEDGGGVVAGDTYGKPIILYPKNRNLFCESNSSSIPAMISSEINGSSDLEAAYNYQVTLKKPISFYDCQLLILADNRRWKYDVKYEPYIGRENPSYIFSMDASSLYNDYRKFQKNNASIPDMKRWLYCYIKGLATTYDKDGDVDFYSSGSDIEIDVWDRKSLITPVTTTTTRSPRSNTLTSVSGNWRSLTLSQTDSDKIKGNLIIGSLFKYGSSTSTTTSEPVIDDFWTYRLGYYNPVFLQPTDFPTNFNYETYDRKSNLLLYDSVQKINYHVAYIKYLEDIGSGYEGFEITIKRDNLKPEPSGGSGPLQLYTPLTFINNFKDFELYSNRAITVATSKNECGLYKRFIDIRKDDYLGDWNRYVDDDNKIYLRLRINRKRTYPTTKIDVDNDGLQFITQVILNANNPWKDKDSGDWDEAFDYTKVAFIEQVKKLGLTYFKLASL